MMQIQEPFPLTAFQTAIQSDSFRSQFGMVLQDTWLYHGTIRDNIRLRVSRFTTDEEVIAAAKEHLHTALLCKCQTVTSTVIAEDGGNLSQGQKQLLCIARVCSSIRPR